MRAIMVAAVVFTALSILTLLVVRGTLAPLDRALLVTMEGWRTPHAVGVVAWVTTLGSFYFLGPLGAVIVAWLLTTGRTPAGLRFGVTFYGASLFTLVLKGWVGRVRPTAIEEAIATLPLEAAFPSGHATQAFAFAFGACLAASRRNDAVRRAALLVPIACAVAGSRLYLQVHWPSDVLAGLLVAGGFACLAVGRWGVP